MNDCLSIEANLDQTGRAFIQDVVMSMIDEGCVAIVPVDTDDDPDDTTGYQILSMRVGRIKIGIQNTFGWRFITRIQDVSKK